MTQEATLILRNIRISLLIMPPNKSIAISKAVLFWHVYYTSNQHIFTLY